MNVGIDCGSLVLKMIGRWSSAITAFRRAWTRRIASHTGRKRTGAGHVGIGQRHPFEVEQLLAVFGLIATEIHPLESREDPIHRHPRPSTDVGREGRAKAAEITPDQPFDGRLRSLSEVGGIHCSAKP